MANQKSQVVFLKTEDRKQGVKTLMKALKIKGIKGKNVLIKPNFNTADPFPGSTHNDTLAHLILQLKAMGAASITMSVSGAARRTLPTS